MARTRWPPTWEPRPLVQDGQIRQAPPVAARKLEPRRIVSKTTRYGVSRFGGQAGTQVSDDAPTNSKPGKQGRKHYPHSADSAPLLVAVSASAGRCRMAGSAQGGAGLPSAVSGGLSACSWGLLFGLIGCGCCGGSSRTGRGPGGLWFCSARIRRVTAWISARWVKACGKLPRWRPLRGSISSAYSNSGLAAFSSRSHSARARASSPMSARAAASQNEQIVKVPSSPVRPSSGRWGGTAGPSRGRWARWRRRGQCGGSARRWPEGNQRTATPAPRRPAPRCHSAG